MTIGPSDVTVVWTSDWAYWALIGLTDILVSLEVGGQAIAFLPCGRRVLLAEGFRVDETGCLLDGHGGRWPAGRRP